MIPEVLSLLKCSKEELKRGNLLVLHDCILKLKISQGCGKYNLSCCFGIQSILCFFQTKGL